MKNATIATVKTVKRPTITNTIQTLARSSSFLPSLFSIISVFTFVNTEDILDECVLGNFLSGPSIIWWQKKLQLYIDWTYLKYCLSIHHYTLLWTIWISKSTKETDISNSYYFTSYSLNRAASWYVGTKKIIQPIDTEWPPLGDKLDSVEIYGNVEYDNF